MTRYPRMGESIHKEAYDASAEESGDRIDYNCGHTRMEKGPSQPLAQEKAYNIGQNHRHGHINHVGTLAQTHYHHHKHGQQSQQQIISYPVKSAPQRNEGVQDSEKQYYAIIFQNF